MVKANYTKYIYELYKNVNLDILFSILAIIVGISISVIPFFKTFHQVDLGIAIFLSAGLYLIIRKRINSVISTPIVLDWRISWSIFIIVYTFSVYLATSYLYYRPLVYFVTIAVLASIIAFAIIYTSLDNNSAIIMILLLALTVRYNIFYEFRGYGSGDFYVHTSWVESIINNNHLVEDMKRYYDSPLFHLTIVTTVMLTSLSIKSSYFFSIAFFYIISSMFVYFVGSQFMDTRLALFAMLLLNLSDISISTSVITISPATLVFPIFLMMLYISLKKKEQIKGKMILIFLMFFIILTHQLSTFVVFILLTVFYLSLRLYNQDHSTIGITMILLFYVAMISQWMYADSATQPFFNYAASPLKYIISQGEIISDAANNAIAIYTMQFSFWSNLLFHMGYIILIFFGIIGALSFVSKKNINSKNFTIFCMVLSIFVLIYTLPLTGIRNNAITTRWLIFAYSILVFPAAYGIILTISLLKQKRIMLLSITFILIFFMITAPAVNGDSPIYEKDRWPRVFYKDSEIIAADSIVKISEIPIVLDSSFSLFRKYGELDKRKPSEKGKQIIVVRKINGPLGVSSLSGVISVAKILDSQHFEKYEQHNLYRIFDVGEVEAYYEKI